MSKPAPVIIIFGITGDLSKRKLLPALYHLMSQDLLPADTKIVGISRRPLTPKDLLATVELCVLETDKVCDPVGLARLEAALETHQLEPTKAADYEALKDLLESFDGDGQRERLINMSIPASAYPPIIKHLASSGLNDDRSRLLLEKPFGYDYKSAEQLIELLGHDFKESQIYRIDHYLAKETAQNLLTFRLHNPIFIPLWNAEHIKRVHIKAAETIGVEGRANFYEQTGAVRDFMQSHLMQLLALMLMDLPVDMSSEAIHISKQQFFEQVLPADPAEAVRGQYNGYRQEVDNPHSTTETYARVELHHAAERWQGTEIILETGKALNRKETDIMIEFKTPHERRRNNLTFHIQPDEGISLDLVVKKPGLDNEMHHTALDFNYESAFEGALELDAYERVLIDAVRGDQALFASDREVLSTWQVVQPLLDAWHDNDKGLIIYESGSAGPGED
jgi:glucose-6-phosphate 1-dehydrogenase